MEPPVTGDAFEDQASPCPCPKAVIELLELAVKYAEATNAEDGAGYVKTFMEQPSEVWCRYVEVRP